MATPPNEAASVRERLSGTATRLLWDGAQSAGTIGVERRIGGGGWETGLADLAVDHGELVVSADALTGDVTIEKLSWNLDDIAIPASVFNRAAALSRVRAELVRPARVETMWAGADDVRLEAQLALELSWALTVDGGTTELGAPALPPVDVVIELGGDGANVHADVSAGARGEVWSWAGLVKLADLTLVLQGETR